MHGIVRQVILCRAHHLFPPASIGRPRIDHSLLLDHMMHVLHTGMPWRGLKHRAGVDYRSVHRHMMRWARAGVFQEAYRAIFRLYACKDRRGEYHCIDTTFVKNIFGRDCVGRNPTDRGRKATKVSAIVTRVGVPVAIDFFPANTSDYRTVQPTLRKRIPDAMPRGQSIPLYADKGYDSSEVRRDLRRAGYIDRVGKRRVRTHRVVNRRRGIVERFFSWLDKDRRLLLRYDTTVVMYEAWTWMSCCRLLGARIAPAVSIRG